MKPETFEQFKAWMTDNPHAPGTCGVRVTDINGYYYDDADFFADYPVDFVVNTYADYIMLIKYDGDKDYFGRIKYFFDGDETPWEMNDGYK